ncbi:hypothetical protein FACS1894181_05320 [Bacteroidia bacterium]|nr:hypothetical protein FACS1894181_05320 [Bacteroidia bacterium]
MVKRFFWKVWLKLNLLTKNVDNDYIAEVSTVGKTLRKERRRINYGTALKII